MPGPQHPVIWDSDTITGIPDPTARNVSMPGSGPGKIDLVLPKRVYSPDERIAGTLLLTLHTPVTARGLYLILSAERSFLEPERTGTRTVCRRICGFQQRLDREKEYPDTAGAQVYPFCLSMPPPGITCSSLCPEGGQGRTGNLPGPVGPARWILEGTLDITPGPGIRAGVRIQVPPERTAGSP